MIRGIQAAGLLILLGLGVASALVPLHPTSALFVATTGNAANAFAADTLNPPTDLAAAANGADVDLTWTTTPDLYADGYNVYRSTSSGCCYAFHDSVLGRTTTSYVNVGAGSGSPSPPVFESVATASVDGSSLVIGKPAGTVDGDLLIAIVSGEDDGATITPPAGWTQIFSLVSSGGFQAVAWYRVASGEPASFTFTSTLSHEMDGGVMRYSNTHPTTPIDVSAAVEDFGNPTAPTVTTTVGNTQVLRVAALEDHTVADIDYPAGTTGRSRWTDSARRSWRRPIVSRRSPARRAPQPSRGRPMITLRRRSR